MSEEVDWKHRADYMSERHGLSTAEANEALVDVDALWFDPDPKSESGQSVRVIGYSHTARAVLTIILVHRPEDGFYGANGWKANSTEQRIYREGM